MKRTALILLLLAASALAAPPAYQELPPGRYSIQLSGMVCTVCARAIAAAWSRLPEVKEARVDFDAERAVVVVRLQSTLKASSLRRALKSAAKTANLGAQFDLGDIAYLP